MSERKALTLSIPEDAPAGRVQAVFSTFDVLDKQRDIITRGAFTALDGAEVPLIWSHDWGSLPVGKGRIVVQPKQAVFDGTFHLATPYSRDAYETVKAMGALQEYSYGFKVADDGAEIVTAADGLPARKVLRMERVHEVSPVLVGAGEQTRTLAIKGLVTDLAEAKAGRRLSAASLARIQAAIEALSALVEADAAADGTAAAAAADLTAADLAAADLASPDAKPFANEHACRIHDPGQYDRFRRVNGDRTHDGKAYDVIYGHPQSGGGWQEQAYRYPTDTWEAAAARSHCGDHGGSFEAAAGKAAAPAPAPAPDHAELCGALRAYAAWLPTQPVTADADWVASVERRVADVQRVLQARKARLALGADEGLAAIHARAAARDARLAQLLGGG